MQDGQLVVVATEPCQWARRAVPREHRTGNQPDLARTYLVMQQFTHAGAGPGAQQPWPAHAGTGHGDYPFYRKAAGQEQAPNGNNVLVAEMPNRFSVTDRMQEMNVGADQAGGMRTGKLDVP